MPLVWSRGCFAGQLDLQDGLWNPVPVNEWLPSLEHTSSDVRGIWGHLEGSRKLCVDWLFFHSLLPFEASHLFLVTASTAYIRKAESHPNDPMFQLFPCDNELAGWWCDKKLSTVLWGNLRQSTSDRDSEVAKRKWQDPRNLYSLTGHSMKLAGLFMLSGVEGVGETWLCLFMNGVRVFHAWVTSRKKMHFCCRVIRTLPHWIPLC